MKTIIGVLLIAFALPSFAQEQKPTPTIAAVDIQPMAMAFNGRNASTVYIIDGIVPLKPIPLPQFRFFAPTSYVLTREEIDHMPYNNINDLISIFPGIYQSQRGADVSILGSRR